MFFEKLADAGGMCEDIFLAYGFLARLNGMLVIY